MHMDMYDNCPWELKDKWGSGRLLNNNDVINFMHNSVRCNHITFRYSSVSDHGTAISVYSQALIVDRLDGSDERPFRMDYAGTTQDI